MNGGGLTVEKISKAQVDPEDQNTASLWGGRHPPPSWDEYLDDFKVAFRPYLIVARSWLLETSVDDPPPASLWCNEWALRFSDGFVLSFTWRAWGDFVQAVRDRREGYMSFYS